MITTNGHVHYRAPRDCPVCSEQLHTTQLGCPDCGTLISGSFSSCEYCALTAADRQMLAVFLTSRGNLREVAKHLGVSAPTARARYDEMVSRLGLNVTESATETIDSDDAASSTTSSAPGGSAADGTVQDARLLALQALARGDIDLDAARSALD